jgi:hypothetical protein
MANRFSFSLDTIKKAIGQTWDKVTSSTSTARYFPEEFVKTAIGFREGVRKFITPKNPEEAKKMGLFTLGKNEKGEYMYVDPTMMAGGMKIVGKKIVGEVAEKVIPKVGKVLEDPFQLILKTLKEVKPLTQLQKETISIEKGIRFGAEKAVGAKVSGEAGFAARKAQMAGEYTKVHFQEIKTKLPQEVFDQGFDRIAKHFAGDEGKILSTQSGFAKLINGVPPTEGELKALQEVMPEELTKTLTDLKPFIEKAKEAGIQLANIPRSVMSSFDLSFGLRQGLFLAPSHPLAFTKAFLKQFKAFGSEKAFQASSEALKAKPRFQFLKDAGVAFTELGGDLAQREESRMSSWAEKMPGPLGKLWNPTIGKAIRASGRAYTSMGNELRYDVANTLVNSAEKAGRNPILGTKLLSNLVGLVNAGTGRGSLNMFEKYAVALNSTFFSPRLMSSRLHLLNPIYYARLDPFARKEALKSLFAFAGATTAVLGLAKMAGAEVSTDSNSTDFLKIKIGKTRIDIMGGFQQYLVAASRLATGKYVSSTTGKVTTLGKGYRPLTRGDIALRAIESKEAPVVSFVTDWLNQTDWTGQPFSVVQEIKSRLTPMVIQDLYDLAKTDPDLLPLGVLPIFGTGIQTYTPTKKTSPQKGVNRFSF